MKQNVIDRLSESGVRGTYRVWHFISANKLGLGEIINILVWFWFEKIGIAVSNLCLGTSGKLNPFRNSHVGGVAQSVI